MIVEAPRLEPRIESIPAEMIAVGSKPAFSQNVLSSTAVVASIRTGDLVVRHDVALELAEAGELGLAGPVEQDDLLRELEVLEL